MIEPLVAPPYSRLASAYDATLGRPTLRVFVPRFERLVRDLDLRFRDAADLGCGTGLFASYLCRRWGVPVLGVDRSSEMLERAARRLARLPARLLRQDLRALRLPQPVDLATIMFDTLNHLLTGGDVFHVLERVARHLRPGGHLIFDALTPAQTVPAQRTFVRRFRGRACELTQRIRWDPGRRLLRGLVVERRGVRPVTIEHHVERVYTVPALTDWLARAGLNTRTVRDAATMTGAWRQSPRVLIVAVKPPHS